MFTDEDIVAQLKASFKERTQGISSSPTLLAAVNSQVQQRRVRRNLCAVAGAGLTAAIVIATSTLTHHGQQSEMPSSRGGATGTVVGDFVVAPGSYLMVHTHTLALTGENGGSSSTSVPMFSGRVLDQWIAPSASEKSYSRSQNYLNLRFLTTEDRAEIAQSKWGLPKSEVGWEVISPAAQPASDASSTLQTACTTPPSPCQAPEEDESVWAGPSATASKIAQLSEIPSYSGAIYSDGQRRGKQRSLRQASPTARTNSRGTVSICCPRRP